MKSHQTLVVHHFFVFHSSTAPPSGRYVILQEKHRLHDPAEAVWQESSRLLIKQSCRLLEISYIYKATQIDGCVGIIRSYLRLDFFPRSSSSRSVVFSAPLSFCSFLLMSSLIFSLFSGSRSSSVSTSSLSTSPSTSSSDWKNQIKRTIREKRL